MRTEIEIGERLLILAHNRTIMLEYLEVKLDENDMHGVQDAASDIRDIDAEIAGLQWVLGE